MALTILDASISSDRSKHAARTVPGDGHLWEVSWLPGRYMSRNSAITAMVLADVTAHGEVNTGDRLWIHVEGWAAELGLTAPDVLTFTASPPGWTTPGKGALAADPEAAG
jgi:hypothetical protein